MQQFTKREIKASMIRLLQSMPIDNIKVKTIIDDCGISRNTFYYHYSDIYDVLKEIFDEILRKVLETDANNFNWEEVFHKVANSALINRNVIYNIFSSRYFENIKAYVDNAIGNIIAEKMREQCILKNQSINEDDIRIISTFYKHAVNGTFVEWIHNGMKTDPKVFIEKIGKLFPKDIENSIDLI